jgi:hypothetical protein
VPLRRRLCDSDCQIDFSVLQQFKAESGTDYIAIPMVRSDGETNAITFDTDLGNGFTASEIAGRTAGLLPHCQKPVGFVVTSASFAAAAPNISKVSIFINYVEWSNLRNYFPRPSNG